MAPTESGEALAREIARIRSKDKNKLSNYQKDLLEWSNNVDRRYAWVVLFALWLIIFATLGTYRVYGLIFARVTEDGYYTREEASWPVLLTTTLETLLGPIVSIINFYLSFRMSMLIGGICLVLGNGLTTWSSSLIIDTLLLGIVQGIGYGFIFIPFMEVVNNYFLKYRNIALGVAMSGGTLSVFGLIPLFKWLLATYPWRYSYLALGILCCLVPLISVVLKPNIRPTPPSRRQSRIAAATQDSDRLRKLGVFSMEAPKATENDDLEKEVDIYIPPPKPLSDLLSRTATMSSMNSHWSYCDEPGQGGASKQFESSIVWSVVKTPAFHLIWYVYFLYFCVFCIYLLVLVDYGTDRGCSPEEAAALLQFQSIGELVGRIGLPILLDMGFFSQRSAVILNFAFMSLFLAVVTMSSGYIMMAATTVGVTATCSFAYILMNGLLVDYLAERHVTLGLGLASFICGLLMISNPLVVGFFRDKLGSYDLLMLSMSAASALAAVSWILEPLITRCFKKKDTEIEPPIDA